MSVDPRGRRVLRPRPHAAGRRVRHGLLRGDARVRASPPDRSPARDCCTGCSTRSARRCRRWPWPARARGMAKGRPRAAVQAAGLAAAPELVALVQPLAAAAVRRAIARTDARWSWRPPSPYDLVAPLAELLGLDDVIATRYDVDADGVFTGGLVRTVRVERRQARRGARRGPTSTASTSPPATPTATASTTRRCWPPSATLRRQPRSADAAAGRGAPLAGARSRPPAGSGDPDARRRCTTWPASRSSTPTSRRWR